MTPRQYSPSKYKARYESLPVMLDDGSMASVKINKYRLASSKDPRFALDKTAHDAFEKRLYDEKSVRVRVDAGEGAQEFELKRNLVVGFARLVFEGKGAPEHCQIILQLASRWHSEKPHQPPLDLQAYADNALGLDCNGFVGNYLWHILHEQNWQDTGTKNSDADGPSSTIPTYFNRVRIRYWQDMQPDRCYIFGMVGRDGNIVRGGSSSAADSGHITITEPSGFRYGMLLRRRLSGRLDPLPTPLCGWSPSTPCRLPEPTGLSLPDQWSGSSIWGFRPGYLPDLSDPALEAVHVIESTAGHNPPGLCDSYYTLISARNGVFKIDRGTEMQAGHREVSFRIADVG